MLLDKYKDALGVPRVGIHAARIPFLDYALWDVVGTIGIAWLLVLVFAKDKSWQNTLRWIIIAFALGLFLHILFGVRTKMVESLGVV
jgi:RsiW-degrading membrane proteinase PrsW (M82 family)